MKRAFCILFVISFPPPAFADKAAADACAAGLSGDAKTIYAAVAPGVAAAADKPAFVKSKVLGLALGGSIGRADARKNAEAAGECLKQMR